MCRFLPVARRLWGPRESASMRSRRFTKRPCACVRNSARPRAGGRNAHQLVLFENRLRRNAHAHPRARARACQGLAVSRRGRRARSRGLALAATSGASRTWGAAALGCVHGCAGLPCAARCLLPCARSGCGRVCRGRMRPFIVGMYGAGRTGGQARTRCGRGCALKLPPAACDPPTCSAAFSARVIVSLLDLAVLGAWRCAPVVLACVSLRSRGQQARVSSEASGRGFCPRSPGRLPCFECFAGALATCCLRAACWPSLLLAAGLAPALMCLSPLAPAQARFGETRGTLTVTGTPRRGPRLGGGGGSCRRGFRPLAATRGDWSQAGVCPGASRLAPWALSPACSPPSACAWLRLPCRLSSSRKLKTLPSWLLEMKFADDTPCGESFSFP